MGVVVQNHLKPFAMGFHAYGSSWAAYMQQRRPALARRELLSPLTGDEYFHALFLTMLVFGQSPNPHKHRLSAEAQCLHYVVLSSTANFTFRFPCPDFLVGV